MVCQKSVLKGEFQLVRVINLDGAVLYAFLNLLLSVFSKEHIGTGIDILQRNHYQVVTDFLIGSVHHIANHRGDIAVILLLKKIVRPLIDIIGHKRAEAVIRGPILANTLLEPVIVQSDEVAHLVHPVVSQFHISVEAVVVEVVITGRPHSDILDGKDNLRRIIPETIDPSVTDILLVLLVVEVKVFFSEFLARGVALFLIVLELVLDGPVGGIGVLEVALIETGEEGELDVDFHLSKNFRG